MRSSWHLRHPVGDTPTYNYKIKPAATLTSHVHKESLIRDLCLNLTFYFCTRSTGMTIVIPVEPFNKPIICNRLIKWLNYASS